MDNTNKTGAVNRVKPELKESDPDAPTCSPIRQYINEVCEGAVMWDPEILDAAIIGTAERCSKPNLVVYDYNKLIECFVKDGMTEEEAAEWVSFNIAGAWVGDGTPLLFNPLPDDIKPTAP